MSKLLSEDEKGLKTSFSKAKTIGILSIKGGVGKTSTVAALGAAIAGFDKNVLLIDANFSAPNLGLHLGIVNPQVTIHHVLQNKAKAENAIYEYGNMHVIPASLLSRKVKNPLKLKDKIKHLKEYYDIMLIDSSPALNDETLAAMIASDELLVVTTPDYQTLSTTLRAVKLAKQRRTPISGLILNKAHNKKFELSIDDIEDATGVPVLAILPYDVNVLEALSRATPSTIYKEKSDGTIEYKKLAAALIGEEYNDPRFIAKLKNLFKKLPKQDVNRDKLFLER